MNPTRRALAQTFLLAIVGLLLFNMTWYMLAVNLPQIQGMVMVTAAIAIAFVSAKVYWGGRYPSPADSSGKTPRVVNIVIIIVLVLMIVVPYVLLKLFYGY